MSPFTRLALAATLVATVATTHAAPVTGQGTWETTLQGRDINGNAVASNAPSAAFFYDTTLNVTWLANMNANGRMNWGGAMAWAGALTTGGFTDWRLPTVIDSGSPGCDFSFAGGTDCGYNVQTQVGSAYSEWAHLYYLTLGNLGFCNPATSRISACTEQTGWGLSNTAYFQNMQSFFYWSGTVYVSPGSGDVWYFRNLDGLQHYTRTSAGFYAVAVRSGDVLRVTGTVPEPQSLLLALTALAGLGVALRRRRAA